jgi:hypothetical protein
LRPASLEVDQSGTYRAAAAPLGNNDLSLARGRAVAYVFHSKELSICPASAGHFFVVACCYRGSSRPAPFAAAIEDPNSGAANMKEYAVSKKRQVATQHEK